MVPRRDFSAKDWVWLLGAGLLLVIVLEPGFVLQLGAAWLIFGLVAVPLLLVAFVLAWLLDWLEGVTEWVEGRLALARRSLRRVPQSSWWQRVVHGLRPSSAQ